jgi:hypothetical protein
LSTYDYASLFKTEFDKLLQSHLLILDILERYPTLKEEYGYRMRRLGEMLDEYKKLLDLDLIG